MKNYILTPGPTPIPDFVREALSRPIIHHRTPQFQAILKEAMEGLKYIFQTSRDVFILASSGTGAMEAAVANLVSPGDKVIVVEGGKFGERWREICQAYGANVISVPVEWGRAVRPEEITEALEKHPDAKVVFITHCETSTGIDTDVEKIAQVVSKSSAVLVVDAISSMGVSPLLMDQWQADVVVSGSQKGLMLPPGLGFIAVSEKAWKLVEEVKSPRYYLDLRKYGKVAGKPDTPFTPAVSLIVALREVIRFYKDQGIENLWAKYSRMAKAVRSAVEVMGLELFSQNPSNGVTAVKVPEGVDGAKLVKTMRDEYGVTVAGGQAHLKGKIFRMAHMGWIEEFDIIVGLSCLETVLSKMGFKVNEGGIRKAEEILFGK